jgi:cysteinyl-tRNA synthetase
MTHAVFGDSVDIHSGGVDLKFPHHTNEIAQSEAHSCSADPWCGHWVHTGHLFIDGLKMSKSLKNFVSIKDYLASDSYSAQPVRDLWVFLLQHKYSSDLHFSADRLKQAAVVRRRIDDFIALVTAQESRAVPRLKYNNDAITLLSRLSESKAKALEALSDDINTPLALAVIGDLIGSATAYCYDMSVTRSPIEPLLETRLFVQDFLSKLGLETSLGTTHSDTVEAVTEASPSVRTEDVIQQLVDFRTEVKDHCKHHHKKNLEEAHDSLQRLLTACDKLRDVVAPSIGVSITDVKGGGSVWHQVNSGREHSVPVQQPRA